MNRRYVVLLLLVVVSLVVLCGCLLFVIAQPALSPPGQVPMGPEIEQPEQPQEESGADPIAIIAGIGAVAVIAFAVVVFALWRRSTDDDD